MNTYGGSSEAADRYGVRPGTFQAKIIDCGIKPEDEKRAARIYVTFQTEGDPSFQTSWFCSLKTERSKEFAVTMLKKMGFNGNWDVFCSDSALESLDISKVFEITISNEYYNGKNYMKVTGIHVAGEARGMERAPKTEALRTVKTLGLDAITMELKKSNPKGAAKPDVPEDFF